LTVLPTSRIIVLGALMALVTSVLAGPEEDREAFRNYYQSRFPEVALAEYINGIYALDEDARKQWMEIEEFPPYEFAIEEGEILFGTNFANGQGYADCFENAGIGIRQNYPQFDPELGEVITLELADSDEMLSLSAYMAYTSRGNIFDIVVQDDPRAQAAYERGKQFYYSKRGQLNMACSDCHVSAVGSYVRADHLGPSLGQPTHFPVYRSKFGRMISLHSRFYGCIRDVRAKPFEQQSLEYRDLEYFLTYMSNRLEVNGPGARK
jgi:sulfur-oxidizing protein SoxA